MRPIFLSFVALGLAASAFAQAPLARYTVKSNLTLLADAEAILPLAPLARDYTKRSNTPITTVVRNANTEDELSQGLEAHLLISSDRAFIDQLAGHGLVDVSSIRPIVQTPLALVTPRRSAAREMFTKHLTFAALIYGTPNLPVYVEPPTTPAGARAAKLMEGFEFSESLALRARVMESQSATFAALNAEDGLTLMLASDAAGMPSLAILNMLPPSMSEPVIYYVAVLASESMDNARNFANYLDTKEAQQLLQKAGFTLAE